MSSLSTVACRITGAESLELGPVIQELWSGYGVIQRGLLQGGTFGSVPKQVVIKHIDLTQPRSNRRGWGSDQSHQRKVHSYQVEKQFYDSFANRCPPTCRVPELLAAEETEGQGGWILILEDLDSAGFSVRKQESSLTDMHACLTWLAWFHATFMGGEAGELWAVGTYWHLATRPEELAAMPSGALKENAHRIDLRLNEAHYQTLVHGDAKIANFCFADPSSDHGEVSPVAAVDFQYVGRGCGMKDVAYFLSSCLSGNEKGAYHEALLSFYFEALEAALIDRAAHVNFSRLEAEWRELYAFAWADFCRFLTGWSPGHWKLDQHAQAMTQTALDQLASDGQ